MAAGKLTFAEVVLLMVLSCWSISFGKYSNGSGEPNDPFIIATAEDLNDIGNHPEDFNKCFILVNNIDMAGFTYTTALIAHDISSNTYFQGPAFTGVFDGNGLAISNLTIDTVGMDNDYLGLFGQIKAPGEVTNLSIEDVSITGVVSSTAGGLAGYNNYATVSKCYSTGSVSAWYEVGGLVGRNEDGIISNCYATGSVTAAGDAVGGLVGWNDEGVISNCCATASVSGDRYVGGLVGYTWYGRILHCYAAGSVSGEYSGGFIGYDVGGFYRNCFWDSDIEHNGLGGGGGGFGSNVFGKSTAEMQSSNTFIDVGWDFVGETSNGTNEIWQIPGGSGYPVLSSFYGYVPRHLLGHGTPEQPYLISDPNEIGAIYHYDSSAHFCLVADVNLSDITWSTAPISRFRGCLDGNRHSITALHIDGGPYLGLIGIAGPGSEIRNLGLISANIDAKNNDYAGGLVGHNYGSVSDCYGTVSIAGGSYVGGLVGRNSGTISDCNTGGSVSGDDYVGGLVGHNSNYSSISSCYATGSVSADDYVGGLAGRNWYSSISNCYARGSISGNDHVGGLTGDNDHANICECYATGTVTATGERAGALAGKNSWASIVNCYATGSVSGERIVGGLVGTSKYSSILNCYGTGAATATGDGVGGLVGYNGSSISDCYATGVVSGGFNVGGLVGTDAGGLYRSSFWNSEVNPHLNGIGDDSDPNVIGKATTEMKKESTFTEASWDFVEIWDIGENQSYPFLRIHPAGDIDHDDTVNFYDLAILAEHWLESID